MYYITCACISTLQVSLVEGIDSLEPFWVLGPSNSASTGMGTPVTGQQIDPQKLGEKNLNIHHIHILWFLHIATSKLVEIVSCYTKVQSL